MVDGEPKKAQCRSCHGTHAFRAQAPGESRPAPPPVAGAKKKPAAPRRASAAGALRASDYARFMEGRDRAQARRYSPKGRFTPGEVIDHPTFGTGVATSVRDGTKVEVLFPDGPKLLIHGR